MDIQQLRLIHRFPGIMDQIGRVAAELAEHAGRAGPWTWYDIRPRAGGGYVAYVYGRITGQNPPYWSFPVIPDEHNTDPEKRVRPDDEPFVLRGAVEAETAAQVAAGTLLEQLRVLEGQILHGATDLKDEPNRSGPVRPREGS